MLAYRSLALIVMSLAFAGCAADDAPEPQAADAAVLAADAAVLAADAAAAPDAVDVPLVNRCSEAAAQDSTGMAAVAVRWGFDLAPSCVRVSPGTVVTFSGNFSLHPLVGGTVVGMVLTPDAASPVPSTSTGTTAEVSTATPGAYGYYCVAHPVAMQGVIYVVP